ncbi:MAG: tetratricopeptide repeat protein, partial [Candidatus Dadabacteria bacterium]
LAADGYRKALEINPSYTAARFNLCGLYLAEKKYQEVISECEAVVADPACDARANAYTNIGIAYFSLGDMVKAREYYDKALQINPSFVYARNEMGKLYMATGSYAQAATEFELAIAGYDAYEEAHYNLGLAYLKVNNTQGACAAFAKVVELSPTSEFGVNSARYLNTVCN